METHTSNGKQRRSLLSLLPKEVQDDPNFMTEEWMGKLGQHLDEIRDKGLEDEIVVLGPLSLEEKRVMLFLYRLYIQLNDLNDQINRAGFFGFITAFKKRVDRRHLLVKNHLIESSLWSEIDERFSEDFDETNGNTLVITKDFDVLSALARCPNCGKYH